MCSPYTPFFWEYDAYIIGESAPIAHYVIVYGAIYGLAYDVPGFSVHFDA